jgi:hypothetical protein
VVLSSVKSMFERKELMRSNKGEVRVGDRTPRLVEAGSGDPTVRHRSRRRRHGDGLGYPDADPRRNR